MNIYTTSATIRYLTYIEKLSITDVRKLLDEPLRIVRKLKSGKQQFSREHYIKIITKFPHLEGCIENYENVKLKDVK